MEKFKFTNKDKISRLPKDPGIYCFKKDREFLYIGKASNIRDRVKNHFKQPAFRDSLFISEVKKIGYIKTDSEIEALILEANLIKKYQPKYNVVWRDDKNYFYIAITKEDFPRIFVTHQPIKQSTINNQQLTTKYTGPFVDGKALKSTLKSLRKIFPYRSCKTLPKKPCLWYQLGRCLAPCLLKSKLAKQIPRASLKMKKECQENAKNLVKILQGKKKLVLENLKKEMKKASVVKDFERAAKIRDQIEALERIISHAKIFDWIEDNVIRRPWQSYYTGWPEIEEKLRKILKRRIKKPISRIEAYDVSNIQGKLATGSMITFIDGQPNRKFYRKFKIKFIQKPNDLAMIKEVLSRRLKHREWPWPDLILIDGGRAQLNAAQLTISNQQLTIPVVALAKRKNELYLSNIKKPILLRTLPREIFNLILQLRDEAHRFAIAYHKKLRKIDLIPKI